MNLFIEKRVPTTWCRKVLLIPSDFSIRFQITSFHYPFFTYHHLQDLPYINFKLLDCFYIPSHFLFNSHNMGSLTLITGPMFAGKTEELIRRINRYLICNFRCIVFKYKGDTRYTTEDLVISHSGFISCGLSVRCLIF